MKPNTDVPDRKPLVYRLLQLGFRLVFALLADVQVVGLENVPKSGPLLVVTNHLSKADPPLILVHFPRRVNGFVAAKYQRSAFIRWLRKSLGAIWIRQAEADVGALREAIAYLKAGGVIGMAPEGTRSTLSHTLLRGKAGAAFLADRVGLPIVPVACIGTDELGDRMKRLRRGRIQLVFGRPFRLPSNGRAKPEVLQEYVDRMMCHVAALLPPRYHGAYAGHPVLPETTAYQHGSASPPG